MIEFMSTFWTRKPLAKINRCVMFEKAAVLPTLGATLLGKIALRITVARSA